MSEPVRGQGDPAGASRNKGRAPWFRYAEAASLGIEIAVAMAIGVLGGHWLERNVTHWAPWTSILGMIIGIGAAVNAVVRTVRDFNAHQRRARQGIDAKGSTSDAGTGGSA